MFDMNNDGQLSVTEVNGKSRVYESKWRNIWIPDVFLVSDPGTFELN